MEEILIIPRGEFDLTKEDQEALNKVLNKILGQKYNITFSTWEHVVKDLLDKEEKSPAGIVPVPGTHR